MAGTGSQSDFVRRIRAVLPARWFGTPANPNAASTAPELDGVLSGPASMLASVWKQLAYTLQQTRIATSTGPFLDMTAQSFFGPNGLPRKLSDSDTIYRARILASLFPMRVTRAAIVAVITRLTGFAPSIVEPRRPADTKGLGSLANPLAGGGYGYNSPGLAYGSMLTPYQAFVVVNNSTANLDLSAVCEAIDLAIPESCVVWVQLQK